MTDAQRETYRETFASIVQGHCDNCGECDDGCPCDKIVDQLLAAMERIEEDSWQEARAKAMLYARALSTDLKRPIKL